MFFHLEKTVWLLQQNHRQASMGGMLWGPETMEVVYQGWDVAKKAFKDQRSPLLIPFLYGSNKSIFKNL